MSAESSIEWTDSTWNPTRGCSRISPGCENCYAERIASRFGIPGGAFFGFAKAGRWTRKVALIADMLEAPLHWKKPRRIFVNSMSDLFHEDLLPEEIGRVFEVMEQCPQHTFQILTKRADVMRNYMQIEYATEAPPANVWLGVSVEDQVRADERIPYLIRTPAAVRFLSVEPLLEKVHLGRWLPYDEPSIGWVIVGGESGINARPCAIEWIEDVVAQCRAARIPVFCKQLGAVVVSEARTAPADCFAEAPGEKFRAPDGNFWAWRMGLDDRKGGDPAEWPAGLRVREYPEVNR